MKKNIFLLLPSILVLMSACSKVPENVQNPIDPRAIQQDVKPDAIVSLPSLSKEQVQIIKSITQKPQIIPKTELILYDASGENTTQREEREKDLANLTPEIRSEYDRILSHCQIFPPKPVKSGDQSQTAGTSSMEIEDSSVTGNSCSLIIKKGSQSTTRTILNNREQMKVNPNLKLDFVQEMNTESLELQRIVTRDLQDRSDLMNLRTRQTTNTKFKLGEAETESFSEHNKEITGQTTKNGPIKKDLLFRSYTKTSHANNAVIISKKYKRFQITISGIFVVAQIYEDALKKEYYVNGKKISPVEFEDLLPGLDV